MRNQDQLEYKLLQRGHGKSRDEEEELLARIDPGHQRPCHYRQPTSFWLTDVCKGLFFELALARRYDEIGHAYIGPGHPVCHCLPASCQLVVHDHFVPARKLSSYHLWWLLPASRVSKQAWCCNRLHERILSHHTHMEKNGLTDDGVSLVSSFLLVLVEANGFARAAAFVRARSNECSSSALSCRMRRSAIQDNCS